MQKNTALNDRRLCENTGKVNFAKRVTFEHNKTSFCKTNRIASSVAPSSCSMQLHISTCTSYGMHRTFPTQTFQNNNTEKKEKEKFLS